MAPSVRKDHHSLWTQMGVEEVDVSAYKEEKLLSRSPPLQTGRMLISCLDSTGHGHGFADGSSE